MAHISIRKLVGWTVLLAIMLTFNSIASAEKTKLQRAKELYASAEADYDAGRYEEAAEKYLKAYDLSKLPGFLYNLGNTYERMGQLEKAADYLELYLESAKAERVAETRSRIKRIRKRIADKKARDDEEQRRLEEERRRQEEERRRKGEGSGGSNLHTYLLLGGGGAAIIAGVAFAFASKSAGDDAEAQCMELDGDLLCPESADALLSREKNFALAADISFGVGLIAAGVGTYFLFADGGSSKKKKKGKEKNSLLLGPAIVPGGAGVSLEGWF
jgi:tetratricopeptide (TPR) repeat protein